MPNIREFNSGVNGLTPSNQGVEAYQQEGRRIGSFYHQMGTDLGQGVSQLGAQYVDHVTTDQMMTGMKLKAQATEQLMGSWNEALAKDQAAPVHDPHLFDTWKAANLDPAMDQLGQTFTTKEGQQWWAQQSNQLQQHFMEHGLADQSTLAGANAVRDYQQTANSAQSLAYNDPGSGDLARGMMGQAKDAAVRALGPNATPEAIEALENHNTLAATAITVSQGRGMIDKAPTDATGAAKQFLSSAAATTNLDDNQRESILRYGEQVDRQNAEKAKAADTLARRQTEDAGHAAYVQINAAITDPKTGEVVAGPGALKLINEFGSKYGAILPAEAKGLRDVVMEKVRKAANHEDTQDDPFTYSQLMSNMGKPEGAGGTTTAQVDSAYAAGRLSDHSYTRAHEMVEANKTDPAVAKGWELLNHVTEALKPTITKSNLLGSVMDTRGDKMWAAFQGQAHLLADQFSSSTNTPMPAVLARMANPRDPWYIGHYTYSFIPNGRPDATLQGLGVDPRHDITAPNAPPPAAAGAPAATGGSGHGIAIDGLPSARATISGSVAGAREAAANPQGPTQTVDFDSWLAARRKQ